MHNSPTSSEFFDTKYKLNPDPWNFSTSGYELDRYSNIIASLPRRTIRRAFEPGCSIGVLTERLAAFCDSVSAIEASETAADLARQRCRRFAKVKIQCGRVESALIEGMFDLIVLSEVGYYFDCEALAALGRKLTSHLVPDGVLLGAHWLGQSSDHQLSGDMVHSVLDSLPCLVSIFERRYSAYRITHWAKQKQ